MLPNSGIEPTKILIKNVAEEMGITSKLSSKYLRCILFLTPVDVFKDINTLNESRLNLFLLSTRGVTPY